MQELYPIIKSWVGEALEDGREKKDILKCLKAFGSLAIEENKEVKNGE